MKIVIGIYLILDGVGSILFVKDKRVIWQIGRILRVVAGILVMVI